MADKSLGVFGVGNAIVDILAFVDDGFISDRDLAKGAMMLVDTEKQGSLLSALDNDSLELGSGGSAANTMITIALSGGTGIYTGKVAGDTNGQFYRKDIADTGIRFEVAAADVNGPPTGTCVVLTTPDAERTMCTHLGVSTQLGPDDIDADLLSQCEYSYIEGYLWDAEGPRQASIRAMELSKQHGVKVAVTFSDSFLLDRFAEDFRNSITKYADVVFGNADEVKKFCGLENVEAAAKKLSEIVDLAFVTDGANGCYVVDKGNVSHVAGFKVEAIDTVGAGDAFAGGSLFGLTNGYSPEQSAKWGNYLASKVVSIRGPRLKANVENEVAEVIK